MINLEEEEKTWCRRHCDLFEPVERKTGGESKPHRDIGKRD